MLLNKETETEQESGKVDMLAQKSLRKHWNKPNHVPIWISDVIATRMASALNTSFLRNRQKVSHNLYKLQKINRIFEPIPHDIAFEFLTSYSVYFGLPNLLC